MAIIEDGSGTGVSAKVNHNNMLLVKAHKVEYDHYVNHADGELYVYYSDVTPAGAGNVFCYIKNTATRDLIITVMRVYVATNEYIDIYFNKTGTATGGTTIPPTNCNLGSANKADGTFEEGTGITGLSGGILFDRLRIPADSADHVTDWPGDIIVPKNQVVSLQAGVGSIAVEVSIFFYYSEV